MSVRPAVFLLAALVGVGTSAAVFADSVELLTGDLFTGRLLRLNDSEVSIQLEGGGILSLHLSAVRRVRKSYEEGIEDDNYGVIYEQKVRRRRGGRGPRMPVRTAPALQDPVPAGPLALRSPATLPSPPRIELRAPPAESPLSTTPPPQDADKLTGPRVKARKHGFSVAPPAGFVAWPDARTATIPVAFQCEPLEASFTVTTSTSTHSMAQVRREALRAYAKQFKTFHVVRDEGLSPGDGDEDHPSAWLLEIEIRLGLVSLRQLQVFEKNGIQLAVLSYTVDRKNCEKIRPLLDASAASFRFLGSVDKPREARKEAEPAPQPIPGTLPPLPR